LILIAADAGYGRQPFQGEGGVITVVMPAKAGIQYSEGVELSIGGALYWIIRFRG
jgi:hypothetical protein